MKIIPFNPSLSSRQNFTVNLAEQVCSFTMVWNNRAGAWFCDFKTSVGENHSVRLVESSPLLGQVNNLGLSGDFRVLKSNRMGADKIAYGTLGSDWSLVYGTYDEWETFDGV